jgi:hypothetical protein
LREALRKRLDLEARKRIEEALGQVEAVAAAPESLRGLRAVEALERADSPEAQQLLRALAGGAAHARLTRAAQGALRRLGGR